MPRIRLVLPACALLAVAIALVGWLVEREADLGTQETALVPTQPSVPRLPVDVTLDASGRPYDITVRSSANVTRRPLATLHAPSRRVLFLGGEETMFVRAGEHPLVTLAERPSRRYPVEAIWMRERYRKRIYNQIVGVVIVERDTQVVRWRQFERVAYGTDAGMGGITTPEWAATAKGLDGPVQRSWEKEFLDLGKQSWTIDADGYEGIDTIAFSNGFGDGGFPSIAGYDAAGRRAQIVLWTVVAPWRLAFPNGAPPAEVTTRERALAACLDGRRKIDGARCRLAPG